VKEKNEELKSNSFLELFDPAQKKLLIRLYLILEVQHDIQGIAVLMSDVGRIVQE